MADPQCVEVEATRRQRGHLLAVAHGEVTIASVTALRAGLDKLLTEGLPVLLDVSGLRLAWAPAPEVFVTAVSAAGGWPLAQLVLFGADDATTDRLTACRVAESVPLTGTAVQAAGLVGTRPVRLARGYSCPGDGRGVDRARHVLREALTQWELPNNADAEAVVTELAGNAVRHAGTPFRLRLVLDDTGLRISVRDQQPGVLPDITGNGLHPPAGRGLGLVARLSRSWGVLHFADGKAVWAVLPSSPRSRAPAPTTGTADRADHALRHRTGAAALVFPPRPAPGPPPAPVDERRPAAVTEPRRESYATADPERAHEFLRGLYGEHTQRLSGSHDFAGFQLVYEGSSTNRFTVERVVHTMPFEGRFTPAHGLVVVHPVGGDLRVATREERRRADPGDALVVDFDAGPRVSWTRLDAEAVRLDPAAVALVAADLTGADPTTVRFDLAEPVSPARAALWAATVRHLRDDVLPNEEAMASPLTRSAAFRHLVAALVETFPNTALDALAAGSVGDRAAPAAVRRAVQFMEQHAHDDIALADIAAAARLGARGLQLAFRRHHDTTPLEYLRRVRLDRAHRDLQAGNPVDDTVGAIAARWGFTHHGNFSAAYLRAYSRSPSVTLRS